MISTKMSHKCKLSGGAKLLVLAVAIYFAVFATLSILRHESFHSTAFDLGIFDQNIWMFSNLQNSVNTVNGFYPFADHIQPILFITAAIYRLAASPATLLALQAALISLGAIPIYLIARKKAGKMAWAFVIAYFLYPPTQFLTLFDFHTEAFLVPFLLFAIYFLIEKKTRLTLAFLFLAGLTKEYIPVMFIFFAGYMLAFQKRPKASAVAATIGAAWLYINYGMILPAYEYNSLNIYADAYGGSTTLIGKLTGAAAGLLSIDKIGYAFLMLAPLAGLSLLGPELLLLSAPGFALVLLKSATTYKSVITHHTAFIMPFLFAAAISGFGRALALIGEKRKGLLAAMIVLSSAASFAAYGPFTVLYNADTFNAWSEHAKAGREAIKMIPPDAAVSATTWAVPHLSERSQIFMFPAPFSYYGKLPEKQLKAWLNSTPDYVILDTSRKDIMLDDSIVKPEECNVAKSGSYSAIFDKDGWVVLERSAKGTSPAGRLCQQAE